jgi:hypothetical protein
MAMRVIELSFRRGHLSLLGSGCSFVLFASGTSRTGDRAKYHGWRILDPAVISASDYGAASLANLQILWFTLIVSWILAYGWLVMGRLLTPSPELLGLLGISGAANVLAKSLSSARRIRTTSNERSNRFMGRGLLALSS